MNWGQIKAMVASYLHRTDLAPLWAYFLPLAEARMYYGEVTVPALRLTSMEKLASLATADQPADFLEAIKVYSDPDRPLDLRPLERISREVNAFAWSGQQLVTSPDVALPLQMTYFAKWATPAEDGDTNWLMTNAPGLYLGSLAVEVARWSRDDGLLARESQSYASAAAALSAADQRAKYSGALLRSKPQMPRTP